MQMSIEKRNHVRLPVEYKFAATSEGRILSGPVRDISPYGIGIFHESELKYESPVELKIYIPDMTINIDTKGEVRHCSANPVISEQLPKNLIGIKFTEGPLENFADADTRKETSRHTPRHSIAIDADPQACYKLLSDFNSYPEWASGIDEARVLESHPDGRAKRVEFVHDFYLRKVNYILNYEYNDENNILSWVSSGGDKDIVKITGCYTFAPRPNGTSVATYELDVTISVFPSKRLVHYVTQILMRKEMKNFKKFVEKSSA